MPTRKKKSNSKVYILIAVFFTVMMLGWMAYLKLPHPVVNQTLSKGAQARIINIVEKTDIIEGIIIVDVDLQRNTRHSIFVSIKDKDIQELYDKFVNGSITFEVPFFTGVDVDDQRLIRVMNHEFVCGPFKDTIVYRYAPTAANRIKVVCAISIPPSYGTFKGIVGIYLKEEPSDTQKDQIRIYIKEISEDVSRDTK